MPKKNILEKAEDAIENAIETVEEKAEEIAEDLGLMKKPAKKETTKKKSAKKEKLAEAPKPTDQDSSDNDKAKRLAKLKEKAAKLAKKVKGEEIEIRRKEEPQKDTLVPIEDYLKSSIHLGTRAITPDMKQYVYKRRADSLAVFNTELLDVKIREAADYLSVHQPSDVVIVCKREAGHKPAELFSKITGIRAFTKKYPAGILTNPNLDNFLETELVFICDPWTDKAALDDARRIKVPVLAICDTNNYTIGVSKVLPGNNKSAKSLGFIFFLLAKLYVEKRKLKTQVPPISEWVENWDNLVPPK